MCMCAFVNICLCVCVVVFVCFHGVCVCVGVFVFVCVIDIFLCGPIYLFFLAFFKRERERGRVRCIFERMAVANLVAISSTFYAQLFHTKVFLAAFL